MGNEKYSKNQEVNGGKYLRVENQERNKMQTCLLCYCNKQKMVVNGRVKMGNSVQMLLKGRKIWCVRRVHEKESGIEYKFFRK